MITLALALVAFLYGAVGHAGATGYIAVFALAGLAPEQIRLLPVTDEVMAYAQTIQSQLTAAGIRSRIDRSGERLGKLIRSGEQQKILVLAVIGAQEAEQGSLSLRSRRQGDLGSVALSQVLSAACAANTARAAGLELGSS